MDSDGSHPRHDDVPHKHLFPFFPVDCLVRLEETTDLNRRPGDPGESQDCSTGPGLGGPYANVNSSPLHIFLRVCKRGTERFFKGEILGRFFDAHLSWTKHLFYSLGGMVWYGMVWYGMVWYGMP
jgi:hypothetical protein